MGREKPDRKNEYVIQSPTKRISKLHVCDHCAEPEGMQMNTTTANWSPMVTAKQQNFKSTAETIILLQSISQLIIY